MLSNLQIRHFAIVEHLDLDLPSGLCVLTGETGAGKSILVDALTLTLGARADSSWVRAGTKRADICATFDVSNNSAANTWLRQKELDNGNECLLRRTINADGRSKAYINGTPCSLQDVRELGSRIIQIHGQHQHQALLSSDNQLQLIDQFGNYPDLLKASQQHYRDWQQAQKSYSQLKQDASTNNARLELLQYQVEELNTVAPTEGEVETLEQKLKTLSNIETLHHDSEQARRLLFEDEQGCANQLLAQGIQLLQQQNTDEPQLIATLNLLNEAVIQLDEANNHLRHYQDTLVADPQSLQQTEQRLNQLYELARKHKTKAELLWQTHQTLQQSLSAIEHTDETLESLQRQLDKLQQAFHSNAQKLSRKRAQTAAQMSKLIEQHIHSLGMANGKLEIQLIPLPLERANRYGLDKAEIVISTNPGQPLKPLQRVASGGELSRISLAIQVICAQASTTPCLIFDEVDVGIGGGTAEVVGKLMQQLGKRVQVLCVTHLPQVAAQGHHHFQVSKSQTDHTTTTEILLLNQTQKIAEIARMLGGVEITNTTLAHAEEMLGTI